jgi:hypothetical protein
MSWRTCGARDQRPATLNPVRETSLTPRVGRGAGADDSADDDAPRGGAAEGVVRRSDPREVGPGSAQAGTDLARRARVALVHGLNHSCDQAR